MMMVVYLLVLIAILSGVYVIVKILSDGKKALLNRMLENHDISRDTYIKYLEKL